MQYIAVGLIVLALITGAQNGATGAFSPNAFLLWTAMAALGLHVLIGI